MLSPVLRPRLLQRCRFSVSAAATSSRILCRTASTTTAVPVLSDDTITTFKTEAFGSQTPACFPRGAFRAIPAVTKWFSPLLDSSGRNDGSSGTESRILGLNHAYLAQFGDSIVPLEISDSDSSSFARVEQPLFTFLHLSSKPVSTSIYLAQAPIPNLPLALQSDLPTPNQVLSAGRGDVYSSSIWLGRAPTYTPLHRDPNPNLFVQLAGRKVVRLMRPDDGMRVFAYVQRAVGGVASARMRGEEMMVGDERRLLEEAVWGDWDTGITGASIAEAPEEIWAVEVCAGDGLFIPKGWWHSIKGVGEGMTGSVNWWFR